MELLWESVAGFLRTHLCRCLCVCVCLCECRYLMEEFVDHNGAPFVIMRHFGLIRHHLRTWNVSDAVRADILERTRFFSRMLRDTIERRATKA